MNIIFTCDVYFICPEKCHCVGPPSIICEDVVDNLVHRIFIPSLTTLDRYPLGGAAIAWSLRSARQSIGDVTTVEYTELHWYKHVQLLKAN